MSRDRSEEAEAMLRDEDEPSQLCEFCGVRHAESEMNGCEECGQWTCKPYTLDEYKENCDSCWPKVEQRQNEALFEQQQERRLQ